MDIVFGQHKFTIATGTFPGIPSERRKELELQREQDGEQLKNFLLRPELFRSQMSQR